MSDLALGPKFTLIEITFLHEEKVSKQSIIIYMYACVCVNATSDDDKGYNVR